MSKFSYIIIVISILSCQTESPLEIHQANRDSQTDSVLNIDSPELTHLKIKPKYPFIKELNKQGFGTDTNRLKQLAKYAYWDLRKTPFELNDNVLVNNLDIKNCSVLDWESDKKRDSIFFKALSNGTGFFFVQVDSTGNGLKNSFDFGFEIWNFNGLDTSYIENCWLERYGPMPLLTEIKDNKLYVFYSRSSSNYELLKKYKELVLNNTAPNKT